MWCDAFWKTIGQCVLKLQTCFQLFIPQMNAQEGANLDCITRKLLKEMMDLMLAVMLILYAAFIRNKSHIESKVRNILEVAGLNV